MPPVPFIVLTSGNGLPGHLDQKTKKAGNKTRYEANSGKFFGLTLGKGVLTTSGDKMARLYIR
jgi:hypothetical protein